MSTDPLSIVPITEFVFSKLALLSKETLNISLNILRIGVMILANCWLLLVFAYPKPLRFVIPIWHLYISC